MILYNVTVKVDASIAAEWVLWMKEEHMDQLLQTGLFTEYRLSHVLEQDETDGITYSAQYTCNSLEDYNKYISEHAQEMREKGFAKFGNKFIAFRSLMEVVG